jgi:hypothetical protein
MDDEHKSSYVKPTVFNLESQYLMQVGMRA